jgi:hypothetical protein
VAAGYFFRLQGRRSRGWWGIFGIALVATGFYVVFDLLDVDGSGAHAGSSQRIAGAEADRVDAESEFRSALTASRVPSAIPSPTHRGVFDLVMTIAARPTPACHSRRGPTLARAHLSRGARVSNTSSADPA